MTGEGGEGLGRQLLNLVRGTRKQDEQNKLREKSARESIIFRRLSKWAQGLREDGVNLDNGIPADRWTIGNLYDIAKLYLTARGNEGDP